MARRPGWGRLIVDTPICRRGTGRGRRQRLRLGSTGADAKATLAAIAAWQVDYVVIDLGPADSTLTLDLWLAADVPVLVTLPDPASIEATYRFAKSAFVRRLRAIRGLDRLVANSSGPPPAALDLFRAVRDSGRPSRKAGTGDPALPARVRRQPDPHRARPQARGLDGVGGPAAARPPLRLPRSRRIRRDGLAGGTPTALVGRANTPKGKRRRTSSASGGGSCRSTVSASANAPRPAAALEEEQTYYEVLETEPGVSDEEVRRAYRA